MDARAELFLKMDCTIGETPVWDDECQKLCFVDILKNNIHIFAREASNVSSLRTIDVGQNIGCIALREGGGFISGMVDGIYFVDEVTGKLKPLGNPERGVENNRFNDGKCDPGGRFWIGTMSRTLDSGFGDYTPAGALYCVYADGSIRKKIDNVTISNGMAWNSAKDIMYFYRFAYKKGNGV
jgi:sugar lactone lactonase YvrE